jgi:methionyl aminopeptidase
MEREIILKTSVDVAHIRRACRVAERVIRALAPFVRPGFSTLELDRLAERFLRENGAESSLKGYRGFPACICTSVNNVAAHGVPTAAPLEEGDVVTLDITVTVDGWHGDAAWTFIAGGKSSPGAGVDARRLVLGAWAASVAGVGAVAAGKSFGDVGAAIQDAARRHGCAVVEDYVGHGIGQGLHEDPQVPNFGQPGMGGRIVAGMVFTIEPMVTLGAPGLTVAPDGWTLATRDGSLAAQFEHTVAVFRDRVEVLTFTGDLSAHLDFPPALS